MAQFELFSGNCLRLSLSMAARLTCPRHCSGSSFSRSRNWIRLRRRPNQRSWRKDQMSDTKNTNIIFLLIPFLCAGPHFLLCNRKSIGFRRETKLRKKPFLILMYVHMLEKTSCYHLLLKISHYVVTLTNIPNVKCVYWGIDITYILTYFMYICA
jgi:hypothetical protein